MCVCVWGLFSFQLLSVFVVMLSLQALGRELECKVTHVQRTGLLVALPMHDGWTVYYPFIWFIHMATVKLVSFCGVLWYIAFWPFLCVFLSHLWWSRFYLFVEASVYRDKDCVNSSKHPIYLILIGDNCRGRLPRSKRGSPTTGRASEED